MYDGSSSGAATGARSHSTTSTVDDINIGVLFGLIAEPPPVFPYPGTRRRTMQSLLAVNLPILGRVALLG
jgi:hypothetical protein